MTRTEQDQLTAENGMFLPSNPAKDEAMRYGYDPMPEFQRQAARTKKLMQLPLRPMIYPGVDS